ncbi:hypothetical protein NDN08_004640 [Rhodosorus marinus]|uniref:Uncharacterized protein n=1 Tax=Rhodosorus marinus TaxID=101924 RepID=A0AAV8ULU0_9RHOD|nr:hypothetical protein NDN08_004640 [Rhodosorus marinus]
MMMRQGQVWNLPVARGGQYGGMMMDHGAGQMENFGRPVVARWKQESFWSPGTFLGTDIMEIRREIRSLCRKNGADLVVATSSTNRIRLHCRSAEPKDEESKTEDKTRKRRRGEGPKFSCECYVSAHLLSKDSLENIDSFQMTARRSLLKRVFGRIPRTEELTSGWYVVSAVPVHTGHGKVNFTSNVKMPEGPEDRKRRREAEAQEVETQFKELLVMANECERRQIVAAVSKFGSTIRKRLKEEGKDGLVVTSATLGSEASSSRQIKGRLPATETGKREPSGRRARRPLTKSGAGVSPPVSTSGRCTRPRGT